MNLAALPATGTRRYAGRADVTVGRRRKIQDTYSKIRDERGSGRNYCSRRAWNWGADGRKPGRRDRLRSKLRMRARRPEFLSSNLVDGHSFDAFWSFEYEASFLA